jgi:hypothetical protein
VSRKNLTSNRRSFGRNPRSFLDKVSEAPITLTINDGVNPEYTISVSTQTAKVLNSDSLPASVDVSSERETTVNRDKETL